MARFAALLIGSLAIVLAVVSPEPERGVPGGARVRDRRVGEPPGDRAVSLFWRRFTTRGVVAGIYGGLVSSLVLVFFSPVVSGKVDPVTGESRSLFPAGVDFHSSRWRTPASCRSRSGSLCAVAGTYLGREKPDPERQGRPRSGR